MDSGAIAPRGVMDGIDMVAIVIVRAKKGDQASTRIVTDRMHDVTRNNVRTADRASSQRTVTRVSKGHNRLVNSSPKRSSRDPSNSRPHDLSAPKERLRVMASIEAIVPVAVAEAAVAAEAGVEVRMARRAMSMERQPMARRLRRNRRTMLATTDRHARNLSGRWIFQRRTPSLQPAMTCRLLLLEPNLWTAQTAHLAPTSTTQCGRRLRPAAVVPGVGPAERVATNSSF